MLSNNIVGCYECHSRNPKSHPDTFKHFGFDIHVVVSPPDCATCHTVEVEQFSGSKKAHAVKNLEGNPVYSLLVKEVIGLKSVDGLDMTTANPSHFTKQEACFACHGTEVRVTGMKTIQSDFGPVEVPALTNWPNKGVGRLNPDGSRGACTSCHARHAFSIEVARKPYTCAQCHLEPDVPGWNVYKESKHGNIFEASYHEWNFTSVPWVLGGDFQVPTCATCHNSLLVKPDGTVIAQRTHDFGARLWVRLFGLPYTHAQPKQGDTTIIKNADGLPLPTTFTGKPASKYLISADEQASRKTVMESVCKGCHSTDWVNGHFAKLDSTIAETDAMTLAATKLLVTAWDLGVADRDNPFDEPLEHEWIKQWLFYGNSVRYASAMTGAPDYAAFKYGWWGLSTNLKLMRDKIEEKKELKELKSE
jgi:hydroxylamine dehydrogenase